MGSKKILPLYYPFVARALSSTATVVSAVTTIANLDNIGCQVKYTGTMTGTLTVLVSNDDVTYDALTFDPALNQPAGSGIQFGINLNQLSWPYLKFSYTNASGSGALTISITGKDLN